jgi:signal transduction histidine kinase
MQKELGSVMNTIRKISKQLLQTGMQDESFEYSVETLCQTMESYQVLRIHPSFHGTARPLSPLAETYLRRMIQELIHNSLRHSSAWHVWIKLHWQTDALIIEAEDDGSGFSKLSKFISLLKSRYNTLRMRAEAIGATIEYKQGKKGLLAVIRFPYEQ